MKGALNRLVLRTRGTLPTAEPTLSPRWSGGDAGWSEIVAEREAPASTARLAATPADAAVPSIILPPRETVESTQAAEAPRPPLRDVAAPSLPIETASAREPIVAPRLVASAADASVGAPPDMMQPAPPALPVVRPVVASVAGPTPTLVVSTPEALPAPPRLAEPLRPMAEAQAPPRDRPVLSAELSQAVPSATSGLPPIAPAPPPRPPDVQVTIGRVDVHAPPPPVAATPGAPFRPRVSLADFQRQRRERGR